MTKPLPGDEKFWFNVKTGTVERGAESNWENRMGPFDTEAEARQALERAAERNRKWDDEDGEWEGK